MHSELQAVFDEHARPKHCTKRDAHDQLAPVVRLAGRAQQQVSEYKILLTQAELAPHDNALDGKLEAMHQTMGAMEDAAGALALAARNLAQASTQWDRYMIEWRSEIERWQAAQPATETPVAS